MPFEESGPAEAAVRTTVFVRAPNNTAFDVQNVADRLLAEFCGSYVAAENSFEAERKRYRRAARLAQHDAASAEGIALALDSIDRKESATGPGIDLCLPVSQQHRLEGYVRARSIRFHSALPPSHPGVQRLVNLLQSLVNGAVEVVEAA